MKNKDQMKKRNNYKLKKAVALKSLKVFFERPYDAPGFEYYYVAMAEKVKNDHL